MDVFLHAEDPAVGDIPALQAQLQESKVYKIVGFEHCVGAFGVVSSVSHSHWSTSSWGHFKSC